MPRNPIPPVILILTLLALAGAYLWYQRLVPRYAATREIAAQRSEVRLGLKVRHERGPIVEEDYEMSNTDGVSSNMFRAANRGGVQITIQERPRKSLEEGTNVAFFFQEAVADGIWDLPSRPPRGDTSTRYEIHIYQLTGNAHGSRRFAFTDPQYWKTTGGHQFQIKLDKKKPLPDLLQLKSTVLVEPRYQKLVEDFRAFGPPAFRAKVAAARVRLGARS